MKFGSNAGNLIDDSLAYVDVICCVCWVATSRIIIGSIQLFMRCKLPSGICQALSTLKQRLCDFFLWANGSLNPSSNKGTKGTAVFRSLPSLIFQVLGQIAIECGVPVSDYGCNLHRTRGVQNHSICKRFVEIKHLDSCITFHIPHSFRSQLKVVNGNNT